jgi:hypothetical protein
MPEDQVQERLLVVHIEVTAVAVVPAKKAKTDHHLDNVLLAAKAATDE